MTKRDLVVRIATETNLNQRDVSQVVQLTLNHIITELGSGRGVELRNFGVFTLKERKSRVGRNPNDPKNEVPIPERIVVKFKPGKIMRQKVSKLNGSKKTTATKAATAKTATTTAKAAPATKAAPAAKATAAKTTTTKVPKAPKKA